MKKIGCVICACLIFLNSIVVVAEEGSTSTPTFDPNLGDYHYGIDSANTAINTMNQEQNRKEAEATLPAEPTPVKYQADEDADYSTRKGDKAAVADMAIDMVSTAIGIVLSAQIGGEFIQKVKDVLTHGKCAWGSIWFTVDLMSIATTLAHAAVNYFMRDTWYITASFTGTQGHTTNKWVGAAPTNRIIPVLKEFEVPAQRFSKIAFNPDEYKNLENVDSASARELMDYRNKVLVEEQRSLENVTEETWGIRYRAQQRSILALASALQIKEVLDVLAEADERVAENYDSKTDAVATLAARRVLYDALLSLKMNVLAARAKMRAEATELDFKPVTTNPNGEEEEENNEGGET